MSLSDSQDTMRQRLEPGALEAAEKRAYERGYVDALRQVRNRLSGSAAFNCGRHRGFEYPVELVEAMIREAR